MKELINKKNHEEIKKWYIEEIKKRDEMIDRLKEENLMLMKTALKKADEMVERTEKSKLANSKNLKKGDSKKNSGGLM